MHSVRRPAVVERRVTGELEGGPAADRARLPDQQVAGPAAAPGLRHAEVDYLADRLRPLKTGQQDVGVGQVKLLRPRAAAAPQREVTALAGVEQRPEQGGSVEPGRAVPV